MSAPVRSYELTYILGEQASPEDGKAKAETVKELISSLGGKPNREELWGRRELAYPIKSNRSGFYTTLWFDLPTNQLKPLNQQLRFDEEIIRSLATIAIEYAQPGSLYPVAETEKSAGSGRGGKDEKASAEAMLRMSSSQRPAKTSDEEQPEAEEDLPEEERRKKLDEKLDELLNEEA